MPHFPFQHLFRLLDQREQEKMEWELLEGRVDGRTKVPPPSLSHGLVSQQIGSKMAKRLPKCLPSRAFARATPNTSLIACPR